MQLSRTLHYARVEKKFFKKHRDLIPKYAEVLRQLETDPFDGTLKTHKLKGELDKYYACSLTYQYRIILTIKIVDDEIVLMDIGSHDEVY
jgi:addiction module RelE/StbE family toxin